MKYFLFARPSFLGGAAHILDFGNTLFVYNYSPTPAVADYIAMKNDWVVVGDDLWQALKEVADEEPELQPSRIA